MSAADLIAALIYALSVAALFVAFLEEARTERVPLGPLSFFMLGLFVVLWPLTLSLAAWEMQLDAKRALVRSRPTPPRWEA